MTKFPNPNQIPMTNDQTPKKIWFIATLLAYGMMMACTVGCSNRITPPLNPAHPAAIYLCDYGVHSSLLLPVGQHRYVEYLYGDWNWAALHHTSWIDAIGAMLFSKQPALGRRYITQLPDENMPIPPDGVKTEVRLIVAGDGCKTVIDQLANRWDKHRDTAFTPEPSFGQMTFVKDDEPYNMFHNCNGMTADCLHQMGCRVDGYAVVSTFEVAPPAK